MFEIKLNNITKTAKEIVSFLIMNRLKFSFKVEMH